MLVISKELKKAYPGGYIGILAVSGLKNCESCPALDSKKEELEESIRAKYVSYDRPRLKLEEPMNTYVEYYKHFKKTYYVQLQLESVVFKGKSIPRINALAEIMFMAELKNQLLTAGHDLGALRLPMKAELASGNERYMSLSGQEKETAAGDMFLADGQGVISSIIYGPDDRTQITMDTESAVYTVYAPPGIGKSAVHHHFEDMVSYCRLVSPEAPVELKEVYEI
jgi:DNA/RNA-binding domain of Phe-tRNA-synthetase-like protein